jgi:xanthine dehydrogenase large subunit
MKKTIEVSEFEHTIHKESVQHVRGTSKYLDDIPVMQGCLYGYVFSAPIAHARILHLDISNATKYPGVVAVLTSEDIPGENQIGGIIPDEPLLAEKEIHFAGQPVAFIVAETESIAREAGAMIRMEYHPLPVITDPREAASKNDFIIPPRTFSMGNPENIFTQCDYIFEGKAESGAQEHLYLETQGAYAHPNGYDGIKIYSSTQGPTALQRTAARVIGLSMHAIEVDVARLGGGFGGKEDQATAWGVMCGLATFKLNRPVKLVLHRLDDLKMTGKRHPYSSDYKIGLNKHYKILAYEACYYQNAGAAADLSPAVLERTLFHATNSYFIPHVKVTAYSCRTNLPPNTAFRGFGGPQGMFVMESAIQHAAESLGVPAYTIQSANLLKEGDELPYGQKFGAEENRRCWQKAMDMYSADLMIDSVNNFNKANPVIKKGVAVMPVTFGISFTNTQMNNARALVHIYTDGSVGVSTGAVEMGQGVHAKMIQVAAYYLGIDAALIKLETTNTTRVANTSPSAASATADLNGKALADACRQITGRLKKFLSSQWDVSPDKISFSENKIFVYGAPTLLTWKELVSQAFSARINLSAKGHYATPEIYFDKSVEKGHPFAYHVCGTAVFEVTLDCIRGRYKVDAVRLVHDSGSSMNRLIDLGQVEGGLVQGIGWMTMEEVIYDRDGKLRSGALSTYKIPDIYATPREIRVEFLNATGSELAICRSKAVGEPPLMYGIGVYFALRNALRAFNPSIKPGEYISPMTPERALMGLVGLDMQA